nr:twin-arginine translocase subunit TatC [Microlunatus elymi]
MTLHGRPVHWSGIKINFARLRPPKMPPDGQMTLTDHLRELRYRLVVIVIAIMVGTVVAYIFNAQLFDLLLRPYAIAAANLQHSHSGLHLMPVIEGVTNPFTLILKTAFIAALVGTSPIWLYQIWAFIVPGLLAKERKWTLAFLSAAIPLFLLGVVMAYFLIPKGITVLVGFTPGNGQITNLLDINNFLNFLIRVMIIFGAGFEVPVFVLGLNFLGILKARHLAKARRFVILGCFVFGAVATPQTDPFSMLMLAVPMAALYLAADLIAHLHDRRVGTSADAAQATDPAAGIAADKALTALSATSLTPPAPAVPHHQTIGELLGLPTEHRSEDPPRS